MRARWAGRPAVAATGAGAWQGVAGQSFLNILITRSRHAGNLVKVGKRESHGAGADAPVHRAGGMFPSIKQRKLLPGGNHVMMTLSLRRIVAACILSSAMAAALVAPGAASAEPLGEQCSGENIKGRGSTFQALAQEV